MKNSNTHPTQTSRFFLRSFNLCCFILLIGASNALAQSTWRVKSTTADTSKVKAETTTPTKAEIKTTETSPKAETSATNEMSATNVGTKEQVVTETKDRAWIVSAIPDSMLADGLPDDEFEGQFTASETGAVIASSTGKASWYGTNFHGRRTANGEIFNSEELTAAHRSLPFGSMLRVTNLTNGRSVMVRINDRGPYTSDGRIIDLSRASAAQIGMIQSGTAQVQIELLDMQSSTQRGEYVQNTYTVQHTTPQPTTYSSNYNARYESAQNYNSNQYNRVNATYTPSNNQANTANTYQTEPTYTTRYRAHTATQNTQNARVQNAPAGNTSIYYNYQNRADTQSAYNSSNPIEARESFTVQVCSFTDRYRADAAARAYNGGWVSEVMVNGMKVFRVNVGKHTSRNEAEQSVSRFRQNGVNGFVKQI